MVSDTVARVSNTPTLESAVVHHSNSDLNIIIPLLVAVFLIVARLLTPKAWILKLTPRANRSTQKSILPVTESPPQQQTFFQRHLESLRNWQKPAVAPSDQSHCSDRVELTQIPTLHQPSSTYQPSRLHRAMTWQQFKNHYGRYDRAGNGTGRGGRQDPVC